MQIDPLEMIEQNTRSRLLARAVADEQSAREAHDRCNLPLREGSPCRGLMYASWHLCPGLHPESHLRALTAALEADHPGARL